MSNDMQMFYTMNQSFLRRAIFEKNTNTPKFHVEFGLYCNTSYKNKCKEGITVFQVDIDPCVVFLA
jgi:hypothetical protein